MLQQAIVEGLRLSPESTAALLRFEPNREIQAYYYDVELIKDDPYDRPARRLLWVLATDRLIYLESAITWRGSQERYSDVSINVKTYPLKHLVHIERTHQLRWSADGFFDRGTCLTVSLRFSADSGLGSLDFTRPLSRDNANQFEEFRRSLLQFA